MWKSKFYDAPDALVDLHTGPDALKSTGKAKAPRYDKTAFGGFGDRAGLVDVEGADVVLVEGWMAGFKPVGAAAATAVDADLGAVDACLGAYARWDAHADAWLVVAIESPSDTVYGWRREAERRAGGGLSDEQVRDFVGRFLPSYEAYCPALYAASASRRRRRKKRVFQAFCRKVSRERRAPNPRSKCSPPHL